MNVRQLQPGEATTIWVVGDTTWNVLQGWIRQGGEDVKELRRRVLRVANQGTRPGGHYNPQHIHDTGAGGVRAIKLRKSGIRLPYVERGRDIYIIHALKKKRPDYTRADQDVIARRHVEFQANRGRLVVVDL
jgi:phage-related protein